MKLSRKWVFGLLLLAGCETNEPGAPALPRASEPIRVAVDTQPEEPTPASSSSSVESDSPTTADTPTNGHDWPKFLGPTGDSKSTEKGIVTNWTAASPRLVWQRPLGTGYAMCSIAGGKLFQFCRYGDQARLTCLTSDRGQELWKFEYPTDYEDLYNYNNGPRCCPTVDGDRVYTFGAEGTLHCLRVADGSRVWKKNTTADFGVVQNFFGVGSTPIVYKDLLIVHVGGSPAASQTVPPGQLDRIAGNGSGVVAFDKMTGEVRYKITDELASYASPVLARIADRDWCFVFARGGLIGFEPSTGKVDFHYPWRDESLESVNASNPVVVGDRVFISETYGVGSSLLKVRPGGYDLLWSDSERRREKSMQTHWNTAVHHKGYLYGSSGRHSNNAELRCIELASGAVKWSEPGLSRSSLLYVDGHFVCLTEYGDLLLLKATPEKFDLVGRLLLEDRQVGPLPAGVGGKPLLEYPAWAAPILSHGLLYVRGKDRLACLELIPPGK